MNLTDSPGAAEDLIRELGRLRGVECAGCGEPVGAHDTLMSMVMGFKNAPRCMICLAAGLEEDAAKLRENLLRYIRQRRCYSEAWNWANREKGLPESEMLPLEDFNMEAEPEPRPEADASWDAGDQGCGELALELRLRLEKMPPGHLLQLTTRDLGAPQDVPAWCGLTGHKLARAEPPCYWIRRRD